MLVARFTHSRLLAAYLAVVVALWTGASGWAIAQGEESDPASTEEETDETIDLGAVEVIEEHPEGSPLTADPSATREWIDVTALRERFSNLSDLLETAAGLRVLSFGGSGRTATVSLRGAGSRGVLVLLDGVPLNRAGEAVDLSTIPLDHLAAIEILRGGQSLLYGPSAMGGVLNLITRRGATTDTIDETSTVRFAGGSFATSEAALTVSRTAPRASSLWQLTSEQSRGDFVFLNDNGTNFELADDFEDSRANNESQALSLLANLAWEAEGGDTFRVTLESFGRSRGEPGIVTFPSRAASLQERRALLTLHSELPGRLGPDTLIEASLYARLDREQFHDPLGEQTGEPIDSAQRTALIGGRTGATGFSGEDWLWTAILEASEERLYDAQLDPSLDRTTARRRRAAVVGYAEWYARDDLTLSGGVRADWISDAGSQLSPKLGVTWTPSEAWTVRANAANAYRPPSFGELYQNRGFAIGNSALEPEVARTFDLGVEYAGESATLSATAFHHQTRDLIEYVQVSGFRFRPFNFGRTEASGLEVSGEWALNSDWQLSGDATWQSVTDETGGANRQGHRIPGQPNRFANLQLSYTAAPWESTLTWHTVGANTVNLANTRALSGREATDWTAGYRGEGWRMDLIVNNVFDATLMDLRGFPLPGRAWQIAYTRQW